MKCSTAKYIAMDYVAFVPIDHGLFAYAPTTGDAALLKSELGKAYVDSIVTYNGVSGHGIKAHGLGTLVVLAEHASPNAATYAGTITEAIAGDTAFADKALVMHVRSCSDSVILVPFHVGEDRSRTWVLTRLADGGLRLKHDHRHADGLEDSVTQYGGDAPAERITATSVEFPADAFTAQLIPAAATNVWTVMVEPGVRYVYALRREGTDRRFRVDFDLSTPVPAPPAPWGHE
jgi:hypothetical protein